MIPIDLGDGRKLLYRDESVMLKLGKKVASSQMMVRKQGQAAVCSVDVDKGLTVRKAHQDKSSQPLLEAANDTITCVLVSNQMACACIMAFTHDDKGNQGIGCDVIRFGTSGKKSAAKKAKKFSESVTTIHRNPQHVQRKLFSPSSVGGDENIAPPQATESPPKSARSSTLRKRLNRRRSSSHYDDSGYLDVEPNSAPSIDIDISGADGGYLTVDMVNLIIEEPTEDLGYMLVSPIPKQSDGGYMAIDPSSGSGYMAVLPNSAA